MINRRSALLAGLSLAPALGSSRFALADFLRPINEGRVRLPNGRSLGYADYGDPTGRLVLYFHGTPGARIEAGAISDQAAAAGVRVVAVERPGMGLSSYQSGRRILDWPADVACLVDALGYAGTAFGVVGMSGGGAYALACLCVMPERITHCALVSAQAPPDSGTSGNQTRTLQLVNRRPRIMRVAVNSISRQMDRNPDRVANRIASNLAESDQQYLKCSAENWSAHKRTLDESVRCGTAGVLHDAALLGQCWGFQIESLRPGAVSIWQGGCDPVAPPEMGHWFHRHVPASELMVDPTAGHLTMAAWHAQEIVSRFLI